MLLVLLLLFILYGNVLIWRVYAVSCYTDIPVEAGREYQVGDTIYTIPQLNIQGKGYLLKQSLLETERGILKDLLAVMQERKMDCWLSGGTLLGFIRNKTILPWDDDCDCHTPWYNFQYIASEAFQTTLRNVGLERTKFRGTTPYFAFATGAALRIRRIGTTYPCCDIFFVADDGEYVSKIDSWVPNKQHLSKKEKWLRGDIYPIQYKEIDGLRLPLPNKPKEVLIQQYGAGVLETMVCRDTWLSHCYPFRMYSKLFLSTASV